MTALVDLFGTTHAGLVDYVRKTYGLAQGSQLGNPARLRREEMARRLRLYRDDAEPDFRALIDLVFEDAKVKLDRQKLIPISSEQNVAARITDEVACLYDRPAIRRLKSDDVQFHVEEKRLGLHELMQEAHRLTFLCNEVLIWSYQGVDQKQKLRIVTPDSFDAIPDPRDQLVEAGVLLDCCPLTVLTGAARAALPHYELWDDTYVYRLDSNGNMVDATGRPVPEPEAHGLGRIPGVLFHRRTPTEGILDAKHGRDIVAAHMGIGWLNIQLMRLAKTQGENQPVLKGDLSNVAAGQRMDGEQPLALPPGVELEMLRMQSDPQYYLALKRDKLAAIAQRYGMSYEQITNSDKDEAMSGKAFQVRRLKLTELRNEQRLRAVVHEAQVVTLMGFSPDGMRVDHHEQAVPADAAEELQLLSLKMELGLDSPRKYLQRQDPDLSDEDADQIMRDNVADRAVMVVMMRALNLPSGASSSNTGNDPKINGSGKIVETVDPAVLDSGNPGKSQSA